MTKMIERKHHHPVRKTETYSTAADARLPWISTSCKANARWLLITCRWAVSGWMASRLLRVAFRRWKSPIDIDATVSST